MPEIGIILIFCFSFILFIVCLIYYRKQRKYETILSRIPGPPTKYPFIGNLDLFLTKRNGHVYNRLFDTITELSARYSDHGIFKLKFGPKYGVFIFRKDYVRDLFKVKSGLQKPTEYKLYNRWLGTGLLLNTNYSEWKQRRRLLNTAFHSKLIESFNSVFNEKSNILVQELKKISDISGNHFDICPILYSCTFDVICGNYFPQFRSNCGLISQFIAETMLGIPMNTLLSQNLDYIKVISRLTTHMTERIIKPWLSIDFIYNLTKKGKEFIRDVEFVHKYALNVINERKRQILENRESDINFENNVSNKKRLAFLELLLDIHLKDNSLTLKEIREEVDTFIFAGHDTTGSTLSWILFLIGLHPEVQQKLQTELDTIINKGQDITYDHINQMTYLDAVIKESMRVYPVASMIFREPVKDIKLGEHIIPKGVNIFFLIAILHKDPNVFADPEQFKPERFLLDNQEEWDVYSYAPFSLGAQNCIGKQYAINEMKIILAKLLRNFEFKSIDKREDVIPINSGICKPENGIKMSIKIRD